MGTLYGYWVDKDGISDFFYCSECNYKEIYYNLSCECKYCHAKMISKDEYKQIKK